MGNTGLGGGYISDAGLSFKMVCLHLLEMAYCEVRTTCSIDKDWTENAVSEALKESINKNEETKYLREVFTTIPAYCLYSDTDYTNGE